MGRTAGLSCTGSGSVFLGYDAGRNETNGNRLHIANNSSVSLIYGEFDNEIVELNADQRLPDRAGNPTVGSGEMYTYRNGSYFIIAYDDGGTVRYKYLDMAGTGVTWVHTTTAP